MFKYEKVRQDIFEKVTLAECSSSSFVISNIDVLETILSAV